MVAFAEEQTASKPHGNKNSCSGSHSRSFKTPYPRSIYVRTGHRFYSPNLHTWISRDPLAETSFGMQNRTGAIASFLQNRRVISDMSDPLLCLFVGNSPIANVDFLGLTGGSSVEATFWAAVLRGDVAAATDLLELSCADAATKAAMTAGLARANAINHVINDVGHKLQTFAAGYSSAGAAYDAIVSAAQSAVSTATPGTFNVIVTIGNSAITVTGSVVNGAVRVGTAYIP